MNAPTPRWDCATDKLGLSAKTRSEQAPRPRLFALLHVAHHGVQYALELHKQAGRDAALLAHDGGHRARVQGDAQRLQGRLMVVEDDVRMMIRDGVSACASRRRASARQTSETREPNDVSRVDRTERCFAGGSHVTGRARFVGGRARRVGATASRARVGRHRGACLEEVALGDVPAAW